MIPRNAKGMVPLSESLGRQFLYVRYNADLSDEALKQLNLAQSAAKIRAMDDTSQIGNLRAVGKAAAAQVRCDHLGEFVKGPIWNARG